MKIKLIVFFLSFDVVLQDLNNSGNNVGNGRAPSPPPSDPVNAQLIQKVNRQRGNLDEQQDRLGHIEQELAVWEDRLQRRLEEERQRLTKEWVQLEERCRQQDHQVFNMPFFRQRQICQFGGINLVFVFPPLSYRICETWKKNGRELVVKAGK